MSVRSLDPCLVSFGLSADNYRFGQAPMARLTRTHHYNLHGIRSCLVASLLCSFTQILWQLLRAKPLKISTIDSLFSVVSNPFRLTYSDVFLRAPVL